jgi:hypothetical protein
MFTCIRVRWANLVDFLLDNTLGAWHAGKVLAAKPTLASTAQTEEELAHFWAAGESPNDAPPAKLHRGLHPR